MRQAALVLDEEQVRPGLVFQRGHGQADGTRIHQGDDAESNQAPCLSLVQFQIEDGELVLSAYQRSSDASLGLPSDIYHLYLISRQIDLPLKSITLFLGNVHIYANNLANTERLLAGEEVKFELNV